MIKRHLVWSLLSWLAVSAVQAAEVYSYDMESYTVGANQQFNDSPAIFYRGDIVDETIAMPFGTNNQFLALTNSSDFLRIDSISSAATWRFEFMEPTTAQSGNFHFGVGNGDLSSTKSYASWELNNGALSVYENTALSSGTLPTLEVDRHYTVYVFYNGSGTASNIPNANGATVASGEVALFFRNRKTGDLIDAGRFSHTASVTPTGFLLREFSFDDNTVYIDDLTRDDEIVFGSEEINDDMESYSTGLTQDITAYPIIYRDVDIYDEGDEAPFGTPNQFMSVATPSAFARYDSLSTLSTWQFDFYEPSSGNSGSLSFGVGNGDVSSTKSYTSWDLDDGVLSSGYNTTLRSGNLPVLQLDRHYVCYVFYNGSDIVQGIGNIGGATVDPGETALFFFDMVEQYVIDGGRYAHTASVIPSGFLIRSFSGSDNTLYFDNFISQGDLFRVRSVHSIPTLGQWAMILLFVVIFYIGYRRMSGRPAAQAG